eukprot:6462252-Amphidinium_carterae.1
MAVPKRKALEVAFVENEETLKKRVQKPRGIERLKRAVDQAIHDNLSMLSARELDGVEVNGKTCRQQLTEDKTLWLKGDSSAPSLGFYYYQNLRRLYQAETNPRTLLSLDISDVPDRLMEALADLAAHAPKRHALYAYLRGMSSVCRADSAEFVAVMRYVCGINPGASASHLECCLVILKEMSRVKAFEQHLAETAIVRAKIDEILVQVVSATPPFKI